MSNQLYLECYSGISGDMAVSALLDLGADVDVLKKSLHSLNLEGYEINIGRRQKCGIDACYFDVVLEGEANHHHDHQEKHDHHHGGHPVHRNIKDIYEIIDNSQISDRSKILSKKIFHVVAKAEAKAHGIAIDEVHFHEVGAVDSIVDIVAAAVCLDNLEINEVMISDLYEGSGHVKCQHGVLPVPVPAVANIVMDNGLNLRITDTRGELVTPTGAAIAAAIKTKDTLPASYGIKKIGIGSGTKDLPKANILRAYIIEDNRNYPKKTVAVEDHIDSLDDGEAWVLETNIDDATGESLGFTMERLLENGANDVFFSPIYMKKNRPAYKLSVICTKENVKIMESIIFKNTTTIGIRKHKIRRTVLKREVTTIDTKYGQVRVKVCEFENETYYYPEYEDIKRICNETGLGFQRVYDEVEKTKTVG
ncbi:protein of unknown function DUF111 [Alkaliphilus metalliredigens QYMF]|uniref:Pyridinium-3,5-bisthiocarboxylic acid mononucleotide nickel insertion protein n=1 Tax=Alkaliphilus metalliredigens (strain QYMF) TaxID=293826 RepID=LARC_ALKMQ|nr:nickel pincer cofactor biosynthesis protein LarC [Alkaliphilus metalliredigens]A6TKJ0.1 RecName: Full=Pyridinium-3,5-bisthiocarboxylic acid mononucleotide nickel insertion protein; Short=P2TMN nickel insertion protein; AltName: Full=Nickel-pincer cofactor biosynthesis protein LarC [Alkaliphilus metalliredigens QYMF]ABR46708.1 protein of unknown function DUF111 [Alkaliphilus metalliredigens QYMF]